MPQIHKYSSCHRNHWNGWGVKDTNQEDRHDLSIEVAVQERGLLMTSPGLLVVVDFATLDGKRRHEVRPHDV
jgi:hypothetical protein